MLITGSISYRRTLAFAALVLGGCGQKLAVLSHSGALKVSIPGPSRITADQCSGPYALILSDEKGALTNPKSKVTFSLQGADQFFITDTCTSPVSSIEISESDTHVSFYVKHARVGQVTLSASTLSELPIESLSVTVTAPGEPWAKASPTPGASPSPSASTVPSSGASLEIGGGTAPAVGSTRLGIPKTISIAVKNTGTAAATGMTAAPFRLASSFSFEGDAYPGTTGTCGASLNAGAQCTLSVVFEPILEDTYLDVLRINYAGGSATFASASLQGAAASTDFGGMYGFVGGVASPNPATGAMSCPAGYLGFSVLGTNGVDWNLVMCHRPHQAGVDPVYDFGGIIGAVDSTPTTNPITGAGSCPAGFSSHQVYGTNGLDWAVVYCYRPHVAGTQETYGFGGMFGATAGTPNNNPVTGARTCPTAFNAIHFIGTNGVDWNAYACYQSRKPTFTQFTPNFGIPGSTVTLTGSNFTAGTQVFFGSTPDTAGTITSLSPTSVTVTVPNTAVTGFITIKTSLGTVSSSANYTVH